MNKDYKESFEKAKIAGGLAADTLDEVTSYIKPGITTDRIDQICYECIRDQGGYSAPLFYRGFPKSCCTSTNHIVCHGIPSQNKLLQDGDIVNVDVTVILDGWHGDSSRMYAAGKINKKIYSLLKDTYECLLIGIKQALPGKHLGDIGFEIQKYAERKNYSVVRDFCGHGIGKEFHTQPSILHYGNVGEGPELRPGMFFTIEPMINIGDWRVKILNDGWTAVTKDKSLSSQFEHTIGITDNGNEIFTLSHNNSEFPINPL